MARRTIAAHRQLVADARNRALRSTLQSAAAAGVVILITTAVSLAGGGSFSWPALRGALAVAVLTPIAAAVHRLYVDPSGLPSATPPTDTVEAPTPRRRRTRKVIS